ncbi:MAG: Peptidase protein, partial [Pseudomonadota bacterium]|nr:Peptidase protein [Pseudomonadota bacterium]
DSMEPALRNGSRILIDTAQCEIIDNKIYALRNENQVFIKRLYTAFDQNKIIAKSDNQLYPELHIDLTDKNTHIQIIGLAILRLEEPL